MSYRWELKIKFGFNSDTYEIPPGGDAFDFVHWVLREWCIDREDLEKDELVHDGNTVILRADSLDYLHGAIVRVIMAYIPLKMKLTRLPE